MENKMLRILAGIRIKISRKNQLRKIRQTQNLNRLPIRKNKTNLHQNQIQPSQRLQISHQLHKNLLHHRKNHCLKF